MERHLLDYDRLHAVDELEIQYRTAEREKQLALAENQNLQQARRLERQQRLIVVLAGSLMLAAALAALYRQRQQNARLRAEHARSELRRAAERQEAEKEFAALQALFAGQEQERRRVAGDLHDSLGGLLYALRLQLSKPELPATPLEKSRRLLEIAIGETRRIGRDLLPPTLLRVGLAAALREWQQLFEQRFERPLELELPDREPPLRDDATAVSLYRLAQELTTNAAKHAGAARIRLRLDVPGDGGLRLRVDDDGRGFDPAQLPDTALQSARSRCRLLGGRLDVDSAPGRGASVTVWAPAASGEITRK